MDNYTKELEKYLSTLETIEINFQKETSGIDKIVNAYAVKPGFYMSHGEIVKLRNELELYLLKITPKAGKAGKLLSEKAMEKLLSTSERAEQTEKALAALDKLNARQVARRAELYKKQILKETNYLQADIDEYFLNAKISGRSKKQAVSELIKAAQDKEGLAKGFKKKLKRISIDAARREAQQQNTEGFRKLARPGEDWQWITISSKPCPDCEARAGVILPYNRWVAMGMPGTGRTICGSSCKCQCAPVSISDKLYPDSKSYNWDKKNLVLTTAGEARTLAAKSNQK